MKIADDLTKSFPFIKPIRSELDTHTHFLFNFAGLAFFWAITKSLWISILIMLIADTIKEWIDQKKEDGWSWKDWFYNINGILAGIVVINWAVHKSFTFNLGNLLFIGWILFIVLLVPYIYEKRFTSKI